LPFFENVTGNFAECPGASSGVTGTPTLSTTATQYSPVGQYPITIDVNTLNGGDNYEITPQNGTLTVTLCGGEIIGLTGITIGASSALVDSYNSSIGYATHDSQATLLSNGTITLQGAKIHGDLIGPRVKSGQALKSLWRKMENAITRSARTRSAGYRRTSVSSHDRVRGDGPAVNQSRQPHNEFRTREKRLHTLHEDRPRDSV